MHEQPPLEILGVRWENREGTKAPLQVDHSIRAGHRGCVGKPDEMRGDLVDQVEDVGRMVSDNAWPTEGIFLRSPEAATPGRLEKKQMRRNRKGDRKQ